MKAAQLEVASKAPAGFDFVEKLTLLPFAIRTLKRTLKMEFLSGGIRTYRTLATRPTGRVTGKGLQSSYGKVFVSTI
jgi:hypothetical protein